MALALAALAGSAMAALIPMTAADFWVAGTQTGDVEEGTLLPATNCRACHGNFDPGRDPWSTWAGSLMGLAGRDPLFYAQLTAANQDVGEVGTFCLRCHVPLAVISGHAADPTGAALTDDDRGGVDCHFCHSLVDPMYVAGTSPPEDEAVLAGLANPPAHVGNAMFVVDPEGRRRGPYSDANPPHLALSSPFHRRAQLCGTCHDVGNLAVSRQPDGTYRYNAIGAPSPDPDPHGQFPLERTFTEWLLSSFANGGVDLGGRFGGSRGPRVSTCQDCHMPTHTGRGCFAGPERTDLASHEFAGAAVPVLDLIAAQLESDPNPPVDPKQLMLARERALSMLQRAASLALFERDGLVVARLVNQTGHKLPTGHIEGRRMWLHVRFLDPDGEVLAEYGHYDAEQAELDEETTTVFEMRVGLSEEAAAATGLPAGVTGHMALADSIVEDNRIPPRGFDPAAFAAAGAPAVGAAYAEGQFWHDSIFTPPPGAVRAECEVYYQSLPRRYVEALRDGNVTDDRGKELEELWERTGRGAPLLMTAASAFMTGSLFSDGFESGTTYAWGDPQP
ncbi:MAG: hypothetical protein U0X73_02165 [Thermoanaerobaculia bacterium]